LMCEISAATPGAPLISYSASSVTRGLSLRRRDSGWPMPPAAPRTATLVAWIANNDGQLLFLENFVGLGELTLEAVAEKVLRWTAPKTD